MISFLSSDLLPAITGLFIASVWIFHGLYSKVLNRIPRHQAIVGRILGERWAQRATKLIGIGEIALGLWVLSGWQPMACATAQTAALVAMNTLEILLADDLLISAVGMVLLNLGFIALLWHWTLGFAAKD